MPYANVTMLETDQKVRIAVTSPDKPKIPEKLEKEWMLMLDDAAARLKVSTALITKVGHKDIEIFAKNTNKNNPYELKGKAPLGSGLYCETVLARNKELSVTDAGKHPQWKLNPGMKYSMISYYGLPIKWPDGEFFGTVCMLEKKPVYFSSELKKIIGEYRIEIEKNLACLLDDLNGR